MSQADKTERSKRSIEECDDPSNPQGGEFYKMDHNKRGLAVVFNMEHFKNTFYNSPGSRYDRDSLARTFTRLGFEVLIFDDLSKARIENTLNDIRKRDFSDSDCFVLAFMSHGNEGRLLAWDEVFAINLLWDSFTVEHCPSLENKPKVFIIQACQGVKFHSSVPDDTRGCAQCSAAEADTQDIDFVPSYNLPNTADFLLVMSTIPGYVSYSNAIVGSFFIHVLCAKLDQDAYNMDILSILTYVNRRVALDFEDNRTGQRFKQQPSFMSTLLRALKFSQKPGESAPPKKKIKLTEDQPQVDHEWHSSSDDVEGQHQVEHSSDDVEGQHQVEHSSDDVEGQHQVEHNSDDEEGRHQVEHINDNVEGNE